MQEYKTSEGKKLELTKHITPHANGEPLPPSPLLKKSNVISNHINRIIYIQHGAICTILTTLRDPLKCLQFWLLKCRSFATEVV